MCGIVGYIGNNRAVPILINGLLSLEYRGYDSAGIAVIDSNFIKFLKDIGRVKNLQNNPELSNLLGTVGIAHTRWATHGIPSKVNSHPHLDNSGQFAVVHNGIIENYSVLRQKLLDNGYNLLSDTDTEVIPNLIHLNYDGDILKAVSKTMKELQGSFAVLVISPLYPDKIIAFKKDSPLVIGISDKANYIASDIPAILQYTNDFYFMDENEISIITTNNIRFYNDDLNEINKDIKNIEWDATSSEKNGFDDYMLKEIYEQPQVIRETIGSRISLDKKTDLGFITSSDYISSLSHSNNATANIDFRSFNKIFIVACGTAMHAGMASKYAFEKFCLIPTEVDMASEFRYRDPLVDKHSLCIFVSQSGETADTIAALKLAKEKGATTVSVVNVIGSSITRISDYTIYTHAGPEIAVASTKAYTCQVTLLCILATYIAEELGLSTSELRDFKSDILSLPNKVKDALETSDLIKILAEKAYLKNDLYFVGRGSDYTVSMEASLKLKEISYIHSEAYPSGELKHGPIALIENGTIVIGIATNPLIKEKTLSNLEEAITRMASVILVSNQEINNDKIDFIIRIPDINPILSPIISVIPLQLFAYHIAKLKNLDVDKPRNLAKSVTVE